MPGLLMPGLLMARVRTCSCGFATKDPEWFKGHQEDRGHDREQGEDYAPVDISDLAVDELQQVRLELERSLSVAGPGSAASMAAMAQIRAIDAELATRPG
jgi:hypothetical protein